MKTLCNIAIWSYGITAALYVTIIYGMFAQFFLGCIHLGIVLLFYTRYKQMPERIRKKLNIYLALVGAYFLVLLISMAFNPGGPLLLAWLFVVPMAIGGYLVVICLDFKEIIRESKKI